jgi:hypothetical protein
MTNRYSARQRLTGKLTAQLRKFMVDAFDSSIALQTFVHDKIGKETCSSINWNQAIADTCSDLINHCQSRGKIGQLLELTLELSPSVTDFENLVAYMVDAGYVNDSQKPDAPSLNPRNRDWMKEYPFERIAFNGPDRTNLIEDLTACFATTAEVERFIGDNFSSDLGTSLRQGIDRNETVGNVIERIVNALAQCHWLNCFVMAVQANHQEMFELGVTAAAISLAYRPPQTATPTASAVFTPAPQVAPKAFRVVSAKGKLTPVLQRELVALLLKAFQRDSLGQLVQYNLEVPLDHIVADGPLGTVCERLIRWCEEQENKLAPLFNAMIKERPHRSDIKPFLEKLADAGIIELDK